MKVNIKFPVSDAVGHTGMLTFQGDLSGELETELELYTAVNIRTWFGITVEKFKED